MTSSSGFSSLRTSRLLAVAALVIGACTFRSVDQPDGAEKEPGDSLSEPRVATPDVVGLTTSRADSVVQGKGLLLEVAPVGGGDDQIVLAQSPKAGELTLSHSVVLVQARCHPAPCPSPDEGKTIYDPCTCAAR
jgi:hypothetical protein